MSVEICCLRYYSKPIIPIVFKFEIYFNMDERIAVEHGSRVVIEWPSTPPLSKSVHLFTLWPIPVLILMHLVHVVLCQENISSCEEVMRCHSPKIWYSCIYKGPQCLPANEIFCTICHIYVLFFYIWGCCQLSQ